MTSSQKAISLFRTAHNCSQSVFTAYANHLGLEESVTKAVGAGFGAGIGRLESEVCGAVSGAVMVIGKRFYDPLRHVESKEECYRKSAEIVKTVEEKYGSCRCRDILDQGDGGYGICEKMINDICRLLDHSVSL